MEFAGLDGVEAVAVDTVEGAEEAVDSAVNEIVVNFGIYLCMILAGCLTLTGDCRRRRYVERSFVLSNESEKSL